MENKENSLQNIYAKQMLFAICFARSRSGSYEGRVRKASTTDQMRLEWPKPAVFQRPTIGASAKNSPCDTLPFRSYVRPVINAWRAEKAENEEMEAPASEIVEDRASVLDDGLSAVADTLKSMRMAVTAEIDRAVTDERKKSDRICSGLRL